MMPLLITVITTSIVTMITILFPLLLSFSYALSQKRSLSLLPSFVDKLSTFTSKNYLFVKVLSLFSPLHGK